MPKIVALTRISTGKQDLKNQKLSILEYAQREGFKIDEFFETQVSSRKSTAERGIDELFESLKPQDTLIVSELSRLGRSLSQVLNLVNALIDRRIYFFSIKENIKINGKIDLQTKVMISMFGLFAELERDFISERTKEGLQTAKIKGRRLGRPKGSIGNSKLCGKENEIKDLLSKGVSISSLSKIMGVGRTTMHHFIESRSLKKNLNKT